MSRIFQILFLDCSLPICKNIIDFCLSCVLQPYFNIILSRVFCVNSLEFSTYNIMSFVNTDSFYLLYLSSVRSLSRIRLFATPWTAACQTSCPSPTPRACQTHVHRVVMPSSQLILCRPLLLLPSIFPSIRVFSGESVLRIRWPKYWSFSISSFN